ncbi:MAG: MFS transporter, partial [Acidimicrobiia bacterium]|nr:MFS transporter [Acidimicrobiia bacterium]
MHRLAYAIYMLMIASAGVTFVFLEDIESDYGLPSWGIGLISALAFLTILISTLIFAPLGDRGHLRLIGGSGIALTIAGNAWIGFATELWSISASRGLVGIGTGMFSVAARKALIGESTEDSGERIGTWLSAAVAGFIAGPGVGAWIAEWGGIEAPYVLIAVLIAALALPVVFWLDDAFVATSDHVSLASMWPLLRRPPARAALACQTAIFFNIGVFDSTVDEYLTDLGLDNVGVGLVLIVIGLPLIILPTWAG